MSNDNRVLSVGVYETLFWRAYPQGTSTKECP